ncbi:segregation and condensation protein A [Provencibacterium massiliense]|uniref:segregation and condensation protein A n=1 Tax=Provencibacterium massiliense TaxID=1841868 RepID=UPI0009A5B9AD|nr:segregation/condensation protein A [Provencibacterium massiliense]RGB63605.1 serine protease [Harryflintia acetispora]
MEELKFRVQEYEGPLDLILQLIQKHKLDIYDIEISALLEQYMAAIDEWRENQLDIASEFLEMASHLVYIKTVMLLPRHEEEGEDPRKELTGALLEYQACQRAAALLGEKNRGVDRFVRPPEEHEADMTYTLIHRPGELLGAYFGALGRGRRHLPPPKTAFSGIVSRRVVSVASRIAFVLSKLYRRARVNFLGLFEQSDRPEMVATFMAVLELIKDKRVRATPDGKELVMLRSGPAPETTKQEG